MLLLFWNGDSFFFSPIDEGNDQLDFLESKIKYEVARTGSNWVKSVKSKKEASVDHKK